MNKLLLTLLIIPFLAFSVQAAQCNPNLPNNAIDFLNDIPGMNAKVQACNIDLPANAQRLLGQGLKRVEVNMNSGTVESFGVVIANSKLTEVKSDSTGAAYTITASEVVFTQLLNDNFASFQNHYLAGTVQIKGNTIGASIKLWFANIFGKLFVKQQTTTVQTPPQGNYVPAGPTGKPEYCDDTYLPNHRNYADNKELWDQYSANTDKVCQSQYGKGTPSPCVHSVQLSINGNPYYLCWYNE